MKKVFTGMLFALIIGALSSCSTSEAPKVVAGKFLNALADKNFEEAKKHATPESAQMIDLVASLAQGADQNEEKVSFEVTSEKIEGEIATVTFKSTDKEKEESLKLRMIDKQWKVSMSKQDMNKNDAMGGDDSLEGSEGDLIFPDDSTGTSEGSH